MVAPSRRFLPAQFNVQARHQASPSTLTDFYGHPGYLSFGPALLGHIRTGLLTMMYGYSSERAGTSNGNNKVIPMKRKASATNVLIIDDDEFFRDSLCDFLTEEGDINIVKRCGSYLEAKRWCSDGDNMKSINAIILDVMLPYEANQKHDVDERIGLIILDKLRNQVGFTGPIIMLTNSDDSEDGKEALAKGCSAFLCKHASTDAIPRIVSELKLAMSGDVLLVPNKLRHLIVAGSQQNGPESHHSDNGARSLLGQNPAWLEIKKELGFGQSSPNPRSTHARLHTRMAEWEMNGGKSSSVTGASAMLVNHFMENAPRPIFITTADGTIEFTNRAAENMFGCNKSTFLGRNIRSAIPTLGGQSIEAGTEIECYIHGANGAKVPVSIATSEFEDASVQYYIHIFTDLTTQKTTEQRLKAMVSKLEESSTRLEQLVKTDPLTGLLNRRGLESVLIRELSLARRNGDEVVGIVIDLDNFKGINDTHGHAAGDLVLKTVSNILQDAVRASDWVGRVGGDEFIVFLPTTSLEQGAQIAERIRSSVADSLIQKNGQLIKATTSLGVATLPYEVETLEQVLELTKSGLKSSKRRGKNTVSISAVQPPTRSERGSTDSGSAGNWLTNCFSRLKQLYGGHGA